MSKNILQNLKDKEYDNSWNTL